MNPELTLIPRVLENNRFSIRQYGHLVSESMKTGGNYNWLAVYLASSFWRVLGKPVEAIDCLRKAVYYAPIQFKYYGLLSLANIYHRTHNSLDAVAALELAVNYSPDEYILHYTLGNVYATLMQFNNSIQSYSDALRIQPHMKNIKDRRHAVLVRLQRGYPQCGHFMIFLSLRFYVKLLLEDVNVQKMQFLQLQQL